MTCIDPKIDVVNINSYLKFGEILSLCSQDIERKRNFWRKSRATTLVQIWKNDVKQSPARFCHINAYIKFGEIKFLYKSAKRTGNIPS